MNIYRILSALLSYPSDDLLKALPQIRVVLEDTPEAIVPLTPLLDWLSSHDVITLQESYVDTFDRNPSHSLHLFEHVHGESRDRGQAMVDLLGEYQQHGFDLVEDELPDYVPVFLEYLSQLPREDADRLLGDAIHVIVHVANALERSGSPYGLALHLLQNFSPVEAQPLRVAPVRDMDEAMVTFGVNDDGTEPLLGNPASAYQERPVKFYDRRADS